MLFSSATEMIWSEVSNGNGIKTKNDLEKIIRKINLKVLPEFADKDMAIAALLHNKGCTSIREYVKKRGDSGVRWQVKNWLDKINVVLDEIKNR